MSDQENNTDDTKKLKPDKQSSLSNRLASLRASIRASKQSDGGDDEQEETPSNGHSSPEAQDEGENDDYDESETTVLKQDELPDDDEQEEQEEQEEQQDDEAETVVMGPDAVEQPESVHTPPMPMSAVDWSDDEMDPDKPQGLVSHSSASSDVEDEPPTVVADDAADDADDDAADDADDAPDDAADDAADDADDAPDDAADDAPDDAADTVVASGDSLGFDQASQAAEAAEAAEAAATDDQDRDDESYDVEPTVVKRMDDFSDVQGTPLYMSPEQCRNDAELGPATDIYALGVMLFELLEGHPPYSGHTVDEVLVKHQDAPIPEQQSSFTPDDIQALIAGMLAKDADERPTTTEIIEALQSHVQIAGPDVHGLEEESWSVDEIIEDGAEEDDEPDETFVQFHGPAAASEPTEETAERDGGLPIGLIAAVVVGLLLVAAVGVWISGDDEPTEDPDAVAVNTEPPPAEEPPAEEPAAEEPAEEEAGMVFGETNGAEEDPDISGQIAAASSDIGGGIADASSASEKAAGELEEQRKKQRKKRRRKKKKKKKLREIRLDL